MTVRFEQTVCTSHRPGVHSSRQSNRTHPLKEDMQWQPPQIR
jgi:hypothetical protein